MLLLLGVSFSAPSHIFASNEVYTDCSLALYDFDGDGKLDIAVSGTWHSGGATNPNQTDIISNPFGPSWIVSQAFGLEDSSMAIGDLNNNNKTDVVIMGINDTREPTMKIIYDVTPLSVGSVETLSDVHLRDGKVFLADYDEDGDLDIVATGANLTNPTYGYSQGGMFYWLENNGGTFTVNTQPAWGARNGGLAVGDFLGSGFPDSAVVSGLDSTDHLIFKIIYQFPKGGGAANFNLSPNLSLSLISAEDLDLDGDLDFAIAGYNSDSGENELHIFINNGFNNFQDVQTITDAPVRTGDMECADMNLDGYPDIVTTSRTSKFTAVYLNDGTGKFVRDWTYENGYEKLATGDLNGDGYPDIVVAGADKDGNPSLFYFLNQGKFETNAEFNGTHIVYENPFAGTPMADNVRYYVLYTNQTATEKVYLGTLETGTPLPHVTKDLFFNTTLMVSNSTSPYKVNTSQEKYYMVFAHGKGNISKKQLYLPGDPVWVSGNYSESPEAVSKIIGIYVINPPEIENITVKKDYVEITWKDRSSIEEEYIVARYPGSSRDISLFNELVAIPTGYFSYVDTDPPTSSRVTYAIYAKNSEGRSPGVFIEADIQGAEIEELSSTQKDSPAVLMGNVLLYGADSLKLYARENCKLRIYSPDGVLILEKELKAGSFYEIPLNLGNGLYIVDLKGESLHAVRKLLIR